MKNKKLIKIVYNFILNLAFTVFGLLKRMLSDLLDLKVISAQNFVKTKCSWAFLCTWDDFKNLIYFFFFGKNTILFFIFNIEKILNIKYKYKFKHFLFNDSSFN